MSTCDCFIGHSMCPSLSCNPARCFSREKQELLSLRESFFWVMMFFLVKHAFIVLFVWSICVWARPFARFVTSRLDRQISDLTVQDALGRIHICIGPLLPIVCISFKPSDRRSDSYRVLNLESIVFPFVCTTALISVWTVRLLIWRSLCVLCYFFLFVLFFLNPWILDPVAVMKILWLNLDPLIHQTVQICPVLSLFSFIYFYYFFLLIYTIIFTFSFLFP